MTLKINSILFQNIKKTIEIQWPGIMVVCWMCNRCGLRSWLLLSTCILLYLKPNIHFAIKIWAHTSSEWRLFEQICSSLRTQCVVPQWFQLNTKQTEFICDNMAYKSHEICVPISCDIYSRSMAHDSDQIYSAWNSFAVTDLPRCQRLSISFYDT